MLVISTKKAYKKNLKIPFTFDIEERLKLQNNIAFLVGVSSICFIKYAILIEYYCKKNQKQIYNFRFIPCKHL